MRPTPSLAKRGITSTDVGFTDLVSTFRPSLKLWDYFVNWNKVFANTRSLEIDLNLLNFLLGKNDFDNEFLKLLEEHPQIVRAIPALIGASSPRFSIIRDIENLQLGDRDFDFTLPALSEGSREQALQFVRSSGLIKLFQEGGVKNLVDYVLGVEAGLDSNGRKNRAGTSMELIVKAYLTALAARTNLEVLEQATSGRIEKSWGFEVPVDKSSRRFDFAVTDGKKLALIEVNFYGSSGSKLKSTAGEYKELFDYLANTEHSFIWVTDGQGWMSTLLPLRSAFDRLDYLWNLDWLNDDILLDLFQ